MAAPKLSERFKNVIAILQNAPQQWREAPADPPSDAELAVRYKSLPRRTPDARFMHPARLIYTDGSKQGPSLTGAVYQESSNRREYSSPSYCQAMIASCTQPCGQNSQGSTVAYMAHHPMTAGSRGTS